jgi:uncharacterized UPF0160 family protein
LTEEGPNDGDSLLRNTLKKAIKTKERKKVEREKKLREERQVELQRRFVFKKPICSIGRKQCHRWKWILFFSSSKCNDNF